MDVHILANFLERLLGDLTDKERAARGSSELCDAPIIGQQYIRRGLHDATLAPD